MIALMPVLQSIEKNLSRDLLSRAWTKMVAPDAPPVSGHCAVAAEALYHLLGGAQAGLMPCVCKYHWTDDGAVVPGRGQDAKSDETHWWIRLPRKGVRGAGRVVDPTAAQYNQPFPYDKGTGRHFMAPHGGPSKRAAILIARVRADLGDETITMMRNAMIMAYKRSQAAYGFNAS